MKEFSKKILKKRIKKHEKSIDKDGRRWYNNLESKAEVHFSPASNGVCTVNTCNCVFMSGWISPTFLFAIFVAKVYFWRCFIISIKECLINDEIKGKEVRLIDVDGSQLGIVSVKDAQAKAYDKNLDLVEISPQAKPPVCKIMDYGKYRFEQAKREKETKKNQKIVSVKEVKMSPSIDVHDFNTKVNQASKFLKSGDKVKITVKFRGRELHHTSLGQELLERVAQSLAEVGNVEKQAKLEGRNMAMVVAPKQN